MRACFRRFYRVGQCGCCRTVSTHADLQYFCVIHLTARLWTLSSALMLLAVNGSQTGLAYSNTGRTNALHAAFFRLSFVVLMFRLRRPKVLSALLQTSVIWASQWRSEVILTPRYFASISVLRVRPWSWYCDGRTVLRLMIFTVVHFYRWKDIFQRCSQSARLSRSGCKSFWSCGSVSSLWQIVSYAKSLHVEVSCSGKSFM